MAKLRLNQDARARLYSYAKTQLSAATPDPRVGLRDAFGVFVHGQWRHMYPAADMAVLERYSAATHADHATLVIEWSTDDVSPISLGFDSRDLRREFRGTATQIKLPSPIWIPHGRHRIHVPVEPDPSPLSSAAYEFVCNATRAGAERHKRITAALEPYAVLIRESRYWEDVEAVWPEASTQRPAGAVLLPAKFTPEMYERIERDRNQRVFAQKAVTTDEE